MFFEFFSYIYIFKKLHHPLPLPSSFDPERNGTIDLSDFNMMSRLLHARSSITHQITATGSNVETVLKRMDSWVQVG